MSEVRVSGASRPTVATLDPTPGPDSPPPTPTAPAVGASSGPSVIVDQSTPSAAQQRLRQIQQRAGQGTAPASRNASGFDGMVQSYRNQFLAGQVPTIPHAPARPQMRGAELLNQIGYVPPNMRGPYEQAVRDSHRQPFSVMHSMLEHGLGPVFDRLGCDRAVSATNVEILTHFGVEMTHAITAGLGVAGTAGAIGMAGTAAAVASVVLTTAAIADATSMYVQEMVQIGRGEFRPTPAILEAMRQEIPRRAAATLTQAAQRAEQSFQAGVERAALGQPADPARSGDRAYQLGIRQGQEYRRQHGDALNNEQTARRAFAQAQREANAASPRTVAAPTHFVPVTQLEPQGVAAPIHLDDL